MKTDTCKGCGREIVWVNITKADGSPGHVPLDPRAPTYRITTIDGDVAHAEKASGREPGDVLVSHFATCPKASQFSGGRR